MSDHENFAKRRKVRKGTQSCWECRRRKVRCIFSISTNTVCDHCARRGTPCVSQEMCEEPSSNVKTPLESRIGRIEELLAQHEVARDVREPVLNRPRSVSFDDGLDATVSTTSHEAGGQLEDDGISSYSSPQLSSSDHFAQLNRKLISAWPSREELDLITALPVGISSHLHLEVCKPCSISLGSDTLQDTNLLRLPPPVSHPVLFARKLLMLGTFLQGVQPFSAKDTEGFSPSRIMHRAVSTAITLVITQDEFLDSVEAVESIFLEAMYHNYSGNLHRAWKATRRAITTAQSLSIHLGFASPSLRLLDPSSRTNVDLSTLTFRLAEMDAYLSLLLGLPCSSLRTTHLTSPSALATCNPLSRLSRLHLTVQTKIISRCGASPSGAAEIASLDQTLRAAAQEMPPKWWLPPPFTDPTNTTADMIRLMTHLAHYHLVLRLHLPYVLSPQHNSSKAIAVAAAREILARFVAFRTKNVAHYYCRGSDFLSFIAMTVLCVAHIKYTAGTEGGQDMSGFEALGHARPGDRGLMERALDIVIEARDGISGRIERILEKLLEVEERAAEGAVYVPRTREEIEIGLGCGGQEMGEDGLEVWIPGFGRIDFVRGIVDKGVENKNPRTEETPHFGEQSPSFQFDNTSGIGELDPGWAAHEFDLQGVDFALFDELFCNTDTFDNAPGMRSDS